MAENNHYARVIETLQTLRRYALQKAQGRGMEIGLLYHEEDSYLMRFANSAISLNTNERLIRLEATAQQDRRRASYELITDLNKLDEMKHAIDTAIELAQHAQPLTYQPSVPVFPETFHDESAYDPALAQLSNAERLAYVNQAAEGLETEEMRLSGIFSNGSTILAQINTTTEHTQYFRASDAQVTLVLAHSGLKWEVITEQSAQQATDLNPARLRQELALLVDHYQKDPALQLPLGRYEIVFGPAAIAELIEIMTWIGFNGGAMKRGFSFLSLEQVGKQVFSERFSLSDDPTRRETFPYRRDFYGLRREPFPIFRKGIFQGFVWYQDDADEFGVQPTGHTVNHFSLALEGGDQPIHSLEALIAAPRARDQLYIPYLHYMNVVHPPKGIITASSRFGALLLKKDGSVAVPYNVRLTQSLLEIFGEKLAWLARPTTAYNISSSYGRRNPSAVIVPQYLCVADLEISHSNASY